MFTLEVARQVTVDHPEATDDEIARLILERLNAARVLPDRSDSDEK